MEYPEDLKKVIAERKKTEKRLRLGMTIRNALSYIFIEYISGYWRFKTITKEEVESDAYTERSREFNRNHIVYHFTHKGDKYFATMNWYGNNEAYWIEVIKGSETVFYAYIYKKFFGFGVQLEAFLTQDEWYITLLDNFNKFLDEVAPIIIEEVKREKEQQEQDNIKDLKERFIGQKE